MTVNRDHYYRLASDLEKERIESAKSLLSELIEANNESEYSYALDRLIKGLSSSRASARIGFSTCLTELLSILFAKEKYSTQDFLKDLDQKIKLTISKNNGKNERAILFGKLFGFQAILNSSIFADHTINYEEEYHTVLLQILELSLTKSWIREACFVTIVQSIKTKKNSIQYDTMKILLKKLNEEKLGNTSESLLLYLSIPPTYRSKLIEELSIEQSQEFFWRQGNPLAKGNLNMLSKILKESGNGQFEEEQEQKQQQKGSWQPKLHYVWGPLLLELLNGPPELDDDDDDDELIEEKTTSSKKRSKHEKNSPKKKKKKNSSKPTETPGITFEEFWNSIIDEQFFSSNASAERKYWGFEILRLVFKMIQDPSKIDIIFSKNLLRSLINQTAKDERFLNKIAKVVLEDLIQLSNENDSMFKISILSKLLKPESGGSCNFDLLTKTKTCETIISTGSDSSRRLELLRFFISWARGLQQAPQHQQQQFLMDQILLVVKTSSAPRDESLVFEAFDIMVEFAFFIPITQVRDQDDSTLLHNAKISQVAQDRLKSLLSVLIFSEQQQQQQEEEGVKIGKVIDIINQYEQQTDKYQLRSPFEEDDDELKSIKSEAITTLSTIHELQDKKSNTNGNGGALRCFEILYSMMIIMLYGGEEDSIALIPELNVAFGAQFDPTNSAVTDNNDLEESNEILMDILLTFISQKSGLMKQLGFVIWEFLIQNGLKESNIKFLTDILITKENREGQDKLFNREEIVEDDHDHGSDEEEEEEEEEEDNDESDASASDSDSASDEEDEVKDKMEQVDQETNTALAKALGIPTSSSGEIDLAPEEEEEGEENDDDDSGSESDAESMSDEAMMAIDSQLSAIFQQRQNAMEEIKSKSGNQRKMDSMDARQNMIFFKNRVLDLIEKFHNNQKTSILNVEFILPFLQMMDLTLDKNLGEKAHKILKNKICKAKIVTTTDTEKLFTLLKEIHLQASKSNLKSHLAACSQSGIFIAKSILNNSDEKVLDSIIDIYADSMKNWCKDKSNKIQSSLYFDFINWLNSKRN